MDSEGIGRHLLKLCRGRGFIQTRHRAPRQRRQCKEHTGFIDSRSLTLPAAILGDWRYLTIFLVPKKKPVKSMLESGSLLLL